MALKTGTICSKHESIVTLANDIIDMAEKAKDDGQRMEDGLDEKRKRIEKLEDEVEDLKAQLERAESLIGSLQEENQNLAHQIKVATGEAF